MVLFRTASSASMAKHTIPNFISLLQYQRTLQSGCGEGSIRTTVPASVVMMRVDVPQSGESADMQDRKRPRSPGAVAADRPAEAPSAEEVRRRAADYFATSCVVNAKAVDPLTARLMQAIAPHLGKPHLEIEVRLCILCDERTQRVRLPIETPTVVNKVRSAEVAVAKRDFDLLHELLSKCLEFHVPRAGGAARVDRTHTRDVVRNGVRESFDPDTGVLLASVKKQRLALCDVSCPRHKYDLRFAINQEVPMQVEQHNSQHQPDRGFVREKRRVSYVTGPFSFDLTEVRQGAAGPVSLEVEIEGAIPADPDAAKSAVSPTWVRTLMGNAFSLLDKLAAA